MMGYMVQQPYLCRKSVLISEKVVRHVAKYPYRLDTHPSSSHPLVAKSHTAQGLWRRQYAQSFQSPKCVTERNAWKQTEHLLIYVSGQSLWSDMLT